MKSVAETKETPLCHFPYMAKGQTKKKHFVLIFSLYGPGSIFPRVNIGIVGSIFFQSLFQITQFASLPQNTFASKHKYVKSQMLFGTVNICQIVHLDELFTFKYTFT